MTAAAEYAGEAVPPPILDRINESVARLAVLEKRRRSVPR
jgi:hypothetical protein